MSEKQKTKRTLQGVVVSNKATKTIVVLVTRKVKHPGTGKYIQRSSKIHAHDENSVCHEDDVVIIAEGRPISRTKKWSLVSVVGQGEK